MIDGIVQHLEPGQHVVSHGPDRNLTSDEVNAGGGPGAAPYLTPAGGA